MLNIDSLSVKLFADGANIEGIRQIAKEPRISGFTTNPTLMRKAGVTDYRGFAQEVLAVGVNQPIGDPEPGAPQYLRLK